MALASTSEYKERLSSTQCNEKERQKDERREGPQGMKDKVVGLNNLLPLDLRVNDQQLPAPTAPSPLQATFHFQESCCR